jgi:hypothetical protein
VQVKLRPSELSLRELHLGVSKLQPGSSSEPVDATQTALAIQQLIALLANDKTLSGAGHKTVVLLCDRMHPPHEFLHALQACGCGMCMSAG